MQKCQRPELDLDANKYKCAARAAVCAFALSKTDSQFIILYKENHNKVEKNKWDAFFKSMKKAAVLASGTVAQITAWLSERDILVVSEGNNKENPYMHIYGNRESNYASMLAPMI